MARRDYVGRHRIGLPGLVHWREMATPVGRQRSWWFFGRRVKNARPGGAVIALPAVANYGGVSRAA